MTNLLREWKQQLEGNSRNIMLFFWFNFVWNFIWPYFHYFRSYHTIPHRSGRGHADFRFLRRHGVSSCISHDSTLYCE